MLGFSINYATMLPRCHYEWNMQCKILQLFFNILGDKMVIPKWTPTLCFSIVHKSELWWEELLNDNIINPIPNLQSSFFDHQSTLGNPNIIIAKLLLNFSFDTPTGICTCFNGCNCDLLPHSILLLATKWCNY